MTFKRNFVFSILLSSGLLVIFILLTELTLRSLGYAGHIHESGLFWVPSRHEWQVSPDWEKSSSRKPTPTFEQIKLLRSNSQGSVEIHDHSFTIKKPPEVKRLIFIGDSGTYGVGVDEVQTFPAVIRQSLSPHWEVINAGIPGFSPFQSFHLLRQHLIHLGPDHVVFTFFVDNDVLDLQLEKYIDQWNQFIPEMPSGSRFTDWATSNFIRLTIAQWRFQKEGLAKEYNFDLKHSDNTSLDPNDCVARLRLYQNPSIPKLQTLWEIFERELIAFKNQLEKEKIKFSVLIFPSHTNLTGEFMFVSDFDSEKCLLENGFNEDIKAIDPERPITQMMSICEEHNVSCINPIDSIKNNLGLQFFIRGDDHASPLGHKILADELMKSGLF